MARREQTRNKYTFARSEEGNTQYQHCPEAGSDPKVTCSDLGLTLIQSLLPKINKGKGEKTRLCHFPQRGKKKRSWARDPRVAEGGREGSPLGPYHAIAMTEPPSSVSSTGREIASWLVETFSSWDAPACVHIHPLDGKSRPGSQGWH